MSETLNHDREVQRLKSAVEELTLLNELALAASTSVDVNKVLDIIIQKSIKAVKAEQGSIMLVTPKKDTPFETLIRKEDISGEMTGYKVGANITGWVLKNKQPLIIENLAKDDRFKVTEKEIGEIQTVLCVPIVTHAEIIGVLTLTNKKTGEPFSSNDLRLISILAAQSGQLIHNSQLQQQAMERKRLQHQLDMAREMQLNLLPKKDPQNQLIEIASYFSPADAVGGDYFDYFQTEEDKMVIALADVSGHGAAAALVMTLLKGILYSVMSKFESLGKALQETNRTLSSMIPADNFVTMQLLMIDSAKEEIHIANAGHNPVIKYNSAQKKCQLLEVKGCAINLLPDFVYSSNTFEIKPDDVIVVYTDGINEAPNFNSEMFQISRLTETVENSDKGSAQTIINHIRKELASFTENQKQSDDMVLIAVKIK